MIERHLHPEHLADLRKSGLDETTISMMKAYSSPPADIPRLLGWEPQTVESALVLPYFAADGAINGFSRIKVFPSYKDEMGNRIKYLQRKGSGIHLYLLPAVCKVLEDPMIPLAIVEGEKKTAKAVQEGLIAIGISGIWNWVDKGTATGIPDLDKLVWAGRLVTVIVDSDVWHEPNIQKLTARQQAVFALGKDLEGRGAEVVFRILPPGNGEKCGLDDYLVTHSKAELEALPLTGLKDKPLSDHESWWTSWKRRKEFANESRWENAGEIPAGLLPVPVLDERMIPEPLRPWLMDIVNRMQCPVEFLAVGAIVALASAIGRRCGIRPKRNDDWTVVPNLWGAVIGRPGVMKTPALEEVLRPLRRLELEAAKKNEELINLFEGEQILVKAKREVTASKIKKAIAKGADAASLVTELAELTPRPPTAVRFIVNDATVEKLGELLNENRNGLLQFRDELSGWLRSLDRDGHENDRAFFLEAWNGTGSYTYDRISRGTLRIEAACVSILGGIQPGLLNSYLREAAAGDKGADGLIQRFQLAVYPDPPRTWVNVDRWPDTEAKNRAFGIFGKLVEPMTFEGFAGSPSLGITGNEDKDDSIPFLRFATDAQAFFDTWRADLEQKIRIGDDHPIIESHLAKYRKLMPALALIFHLVEVADSRATASVSITAAQMAAAWCDFLEQHARRIYQSISHRHLLTANLLADKIKSGRVKNPFTGRDIYNNGWSGLTDHDDVRRACEILESLFWLKPDFVPTDGRPKVRFWINPKIEQRRAAA